MYIHTEEIKAGFTNNPPLNYIRHVEFFILFYLLKNQIKSNIFIKLIFIYLHFFLVTLFCSIIYYFSVSPVYLKKYIAYT